MAQPELRQTESMPELRPPVTELGALGWLRKNLFSSWYQTIITLVTLLVIYKLGGGFIRWALLEAKWDVIAVNLKLLMVGSYPSEFLWRIWVVVVLLAAVVGLSWGAFGQMRRSTGIGVAAALLTLQLFPLAPASRFWLVGSLVALLLFFWLGSLGARRSKVTVLVGWLIFPWAALLLIGGHSSIGALPVVATAYWNGLLLTVGLAALGIVFCFPLGVLLALGRQSSLPAVRLVSIAYIELVRAVPLITLLYMGSLMVPLFLPESMRIDNVIRAFIVVTLFSAAYMAENVRGGLQAVPQGQLEAARALGLPAWQTVGFIQLPQALRAVIPAIVGQFISLLKDTTLVYVVSLNELGGMGRAVLAQIGFRDRYFEIYVFIALVFFILCYLLSQAARQLERKLGVGER